MFVFIMLRVGAVHIVNYRTGNGAYRTICSKTFHKNQVPFTLAADNTFTPGMCSACKSYYDQMYLSDLNEMPTLARNESHLKYPDIVDLQRYDIQGPRAKYEEINKRWWPKLIKYQRLLQKR